VALGAEGTEPIRIDYRAEPGCPSAQEFNQQVFRRTASARLASSGDTARTFVVVIERRGTGLVGSLVVRQVDGTTESREVAGPACREVATVLALATALAIDPRASLAPVDDAVSMPTLPAEPPNPATPSNAESPQSARGSDHAPSSGEGDGGPSEPEDEEPYEDLDPYVLALGPVLEGGVTPRVAVGGSATIGWRSPSGRGALSAVGVELSFLRAPGHSGGLPTSSFQLAFVRPELCSVALKWHRVSGVAPCLGSELGIVTGWGENVPIADSRSRFWATIDMGLRLHQALGATWFVELEASVVLPITRYHYVFRDPTTRIFSVPSAAGVGGVRLGARLW